MNRAEVQVQIEMVAEKADSDYGAFSSMHEAYGVLAEEMAEFLDAVRMRQSNPERLHHCAREAIDIAAVALRIAEQASGRRPVTR